MGTTGIDKDAARRQTARAVQLGELKSSDTCERCGKAARNIDAHHADYSRPLDVEWLCRSCHVKHHAPDRAPRQIKRPKAAKQKDWVRVDAQVPPELRRQLAALAKENERSVAAEIRRALVAHVERASA